MGDCPSTLTLPKPHISCGWPEGIKHIFTSCHVHESVQWTVCVVHIDSPKDCVLTHASSTLVCVLASEIHSILG